MSQTSKKDQPATNPSGEQLRMLPGSVPGVGSMGVPTTSTGPSLDLGDQRKVAEAATPGPWRAVDDADGFTFVDRGPGRLAIVAEVVPSNRNRGNDSLHIATFDPETVLALLSRLEQAEKNADTYQTLYEQRAETLEQAEQAMQRVRDAATAMATHSLPETPRGGAWETAHGAQLFAKDILETLDGESNE